MKFRQPTPDLQSAQMRHREFFSDSPSCCSKECKEEQTSMRAYSQDLRERVLRAVDQGRSRAEIVQFFGISLATIKRYVKQQRDEEHVRPRAIPGRPPKKRVQVEAGVLPQFQAHDDATLEQHCNLWEQTHGERVSRWTMSRAITRLGRTRKKPAG